MTGILVLAGTLTVGVLAGALLSLRNGRIRRPTMLSATPSEFSEPSATPATEHEHRPNRLPAAVADLLAPDAVTLVQLSSTFCAPCRHARAVLSTVAAGTERLRHVELDLTERPEVAEALRVLRTPTTIAFEADGTELLRVGGVPKLAALRKALEPHVASHRMNTLPHEVSGSVPSGS
ncbi:thioredoxin family protein [Saccharomonospora xinjiangensis]|uniref:Thioredoxin domain-containing protein n=1 Tax=Saccharomonospora xinjiangensis XJ-54 TaxID=882086 RepID=I0V316_9PSEU|nr:thioredoxin family protein [Saccharomonospora xinjiangensis]EID54519.1 thioredoxin domain-containing protein [Saccharomonospora xinjiangensis XJ-54]